MSDLYKCHVCGHEIELEDDDCDIDEYFECQRCCAGYYEIL